MIIDLGLAEYIDSEKYIYTRCGTPGYTAPEILQEGRSNSKDSKHPIEICDVFSLGVIFHILYFFKFIQGFQETGI